jgi:hypothetical protein
MPISSDKDSDTILILPETLIRKFIEISDLKNPVIGLVKTIDNLLLAE